MARMRSTEAALTGAASVVVSLLAFVVQAGEPAPRSPAVGTSRDYLARMDTDRDGRVSLPEFQAWMGYAFERMDVDHDGVVETHELPGGRGRPIALTEHRRELAAAFARQDRDGDGGLSARELASPPR
jgi:Ca2+-binding EF-hand superfamily protein